MKVDEYDSGEKLIIADTPDWEDLPRRLSERLMHFRIVEAQLTAPP